jgi:peroxisomal 3,2-trans-enoyl-CoA isomerase
MLREIERIFEMASEASEVKVLILTGGDCQYYCAGVNLSSILKPMHPRKLHGLLRKKNQRLFDMFLEFNKPIIAAVNGPAIGASVTSAALCEAIVSSETAQIMGKENAVRMIRKEGWIVPEALCDAIVIANTIAPELICLVF